MNSKVALQIGDHTFNFSGNRDEALEVVKLLEGRLPHQKMVGEPSIGYCVVTLSLPIRVIETFIYPEGE